MNFEGNINTYPIFSVRPYEIVRTPYIVRPIGVDRHTLTSGLDKYLDRNKLIDMIYSNPKILAILKENNIPVDFNIDGFKKNVYNHSIDTRNAAIGIYNNLPVNMRNTANLTNITEAAVLHDIGKVLIPDNILTKRSRLTQIEENIMKQHSILGYELLRKQGLNDETLNIIMNHHQNPMCTGYPELQQSADIGLDTQIVSMADKYSALREKRSYKKAMSPNEALSILYNEMNKGVSNDVYNALYNYAVSNGTSNRNTSTLSKYLDIKNTAPKQSSNAALYG